MLEVFKTQPDKTLKVMSTDNPEAGCWFNMIKPTGDEIKSVTDAIGIDASFLRDALDIEERSRIEIEGNNMLMIINVPVMEDENSFDTLPLGIIVTPDYLVTISLRENKIISFFNEDTARIFDTNERTNFIFQILTRSTRFYLRYLEHINKLTDQIEINLRKTMKNKALFQLFEVQKSLVYFTTALKDNGIVLEKLVRHKRMAAMQHIIQFSEDDVDTLEDVIVENKQAFEMVEMHRSILENMMDAFASIISNNLNMMMKFLTSVTIMLAVPTLIASFWGMNLSVPFANTAWGFASVIGFSMILAFIIGFILVKKDMF